MAVTLLFANSDYLINYKFTNEEKKVISDYKEKIGTFGLVMYLSLLMNLFIIDILMLNAILKYYKYLKDKAMHRELNFVRLYQ